MKETNSYKSLLSRIINWILPCISANILMGEFIFMAFKKLKFYSFWEFYSPHNYMIGQWEVSATGAGNVVAWENFK